MGQLSPGRYGAEEGATRKVSLEITVDRWISDALGKIRTKKSVSNLVNGLLAIVIRQFDPGPSSPLVYALDRLLTKYKERAEASGDAEMVASVALLRSRLEPYFDLAEVVPDQQGRSHGLTACIEERKTEEEKDQNDVHGIEGNRYGLPVEDDCARRDYDWYAVPTICHGTPMVYLRALGAWKCSVCGSVCRDR